MKTNKLCVSKLDKLGRALPPEEYWNALGRDREDGNFKVKIWLDDQAFNMTPYTEGKILTIGIVRAVDLLGRVVIPKKYFRALNIDPEKENIHLEYTLNYNVITAELLHSHFVENGN